MSYWTGLVSGYQGAREAEFEKNYQREVANRQLADRVFAQLLASEDDQMKELALSGLMQPVGTRKKGLPGFFGEVESNPVISQIVAAMNEMIPDRSSAPVPPPRPGAAAMSTNVPVQPGSAPITPPPPMTLPGQPLAPEQPPSGYSPATGTAFTGVTAQMPPDLEALPPQPAQGAVPLPPPAPPPEVQRLQRRGTGLLTARQTAIMNAEVPLRTRIQVAQQEVAKLGLSPEDTAELNEEIIRGAMGVQRAARQFQGPTGAWAVVDPMTGKPTPVSFDTSSGKFAFPDGTPVPRGVQLVRMGAGAGGIGTTSDKVPDTPESRQMLISLGADPSILNLPRSPTGYLEYKLAASGEMLVGPAMFVPPPAFTGQGTILDAAGNQVVVQFPREGGAPRVAGTAPNPQMSNEQAAAQALLRVVRQRIIAAETPEFRGSPPRRLSPQETDRLVQQAAREQNLPYTSLFELERDARIPTARQVAPRPNAPPAAGPTVQPPATFEDRLRQRGLEIQERDQGGAAPSQVIPAPSPPPPLIPLSRPPGSSGVILNPEAQQRLTENQGRLQRGRQMSERTRGRPVPFSTTPQPPSEEELALARRVMGTR